MMYKRILEQRISEIMDFENIEIRDINRQNKYHYSFNSDGYDIDVYFHKTELNFDYFKIPPALKKLKDTESYNIGYSVNDIDGQFEKTNLKIFLPILKTIVEIINNFIQLNKPISLLIFGTDRSGEIASSSTKAKLYQIMIKKHLPNGYSSNVAKLDSYDGLILYNEKYSKIGRL